MMGTEISEEERMMKWLAQREVADPINKSGLASYLRENFYLEALFQLIRPNRERLGILGCVDEGVQKVNGLEIDDREAGAGILMPFKKAVEVFRARNIKAVTSHPNCGAAALAYSKLQPSDQLRYSNPDAYGKAWADAIARALDIDHLVIQPREMERDLRFHDAVGTVVDLTNGGINTRKVKNAFPNSFTVHPDQDTIHTLSEVQLTINIAMSHGFGKLFTKDQPFLVMVVGGMQEEIRAWTEIIEPLVNNYKGRVALHDYDIQPIVSTFSY